MAKIKHSIVIITYNQEKLLPAALESVFSQTVSPFEVIISDDCSTDKTWEIIMMYYQKYPNIIKPIKQQKNLGIFGHINSLKSLPKGDVVSLLAGDDLYKLGMLDAFNKKIQENNLNPSDKWILISNALDLHPNGEEVLYNNYVYRNKNLFKVKLRYALNFRETGFSKAIWNEISPIREDLGYHADWLYTIDQIEKSNAFYFINEAFPVYRLGIGVISKSKREQLLISRVKVVDAILEKYEYKLDYSDKKYLKKEKYLNKYLLKPTFLGFFGSLFHIIINCDNYEREQILINDLKGCFFFMGKLKRIFKK